VDAAEGSTPPPTKDATSAQKADAAATGKTETPEQTAAPDAGKTQSEKKESEQSKK
jgi:hypothetical protein